ncbi:MAG: 50S ribosomal protein L29 [Legionellales bacterium]|jgi:large subunit ribosomal protein L29|nr:50S ribosomal protein L29 [Legionellales bacterium]HBH10102.1 50S ribosomal protein L29 [Gammaproteobacteria bacterium]|tara:strand:+ start:2287 stop:2496 length:210 start_codon:yes stop_codon:yes gene_type:complete
MKILELREKTNEELQSLLLEELRSQFNLRMRKGTGQLDKPSEIKKTRRNIAKIHTVLNENKNISNKESV